MLVRGRIYGIQGRSRTGGDIGSADSIRIKDLRLDPQNPRSAEFGVKSDATQDDLVKVLWERMAVVEVAMSIAYSGFFQHEPLFAEKAPNGKFVVIEGNRRLAAVRLLIDGELRKKLHATDLPTVSAQRLEELKSLPVIVTDRKSLWRYLGLSMSTAQRRGDHMPKRSILPKSTILTKSRLRILQRKLATTTPPWNVCIGA